MIVKQNITCVVKILSEQNTSVIVSSYIVDQKACRNQCNKRGKCNVNSKHIIVREV